jgi:signal transduction histidine kinase
MRGKVSVKLVYRDTLNPFDGVTEDDNLVQSYIPVRRRANGPVLGVFELYTDVDPLVRQAERYELLAVAATVLILATLYLALLLVVRRARDIIDAQAQTIRENNAVLEVLSRESLRREERDRKKFATDLHEDLAQMLSAVKVAVEGARAGAMGQQRESLGAVVPDLQRAIAKVRSIAVDLRPPSLDDLGLVATLETLCREFAEAYPAIHVETDLHVPEAQIPTSLKIVIYRIVESALRIIGERRGGSIVGIELSRRGAALDLVVRAEGAVVDPVLEAAGPEGDAAFMEIRERAVISGGRFTVEHSPGGATRVRATWPLAAHAQLNERPG